MWKEILKVTEDAPKLARKETQAWRLECKGVGGPVDESRNYCNEVLKRVRSQRSQGRFGPECLSCKVEVSEIPCSLWR